MADNGKTPEAPHTEKPAPCPELSSVTYPPPRILWAGTYETASDPQRPARLVLHYQLSGAGNGRAIPRATITYEVAMHNDAMGVPSYTPRPIHEIPTAFYLAIAERFCQTEQPKPV